MATETIEFASGGGETSEPTAALRWVERLLRPGTKTATKVLQQAFRIYAQDSNGYLTINRIEWRDVPTEDEAS